VTCRRVHVYKEQSEAVVDQKPEVDAEQIADELARRDDDIASKTRAIDALNEQACVI